MPREQKKTKPLICVFCEGESEVAYANFLQREFQSSFVIKTRKMTSTRLFEETKLLFQKNATYRNSVDSIDEIWFFFDVEDHNLLTQSKQDENVQRWNQRLKIIRELRKLRKKPGVTVRLLMTSGCIEYWFLLHFESSAPSCVTSPDKDNIFANLKKYIPSYEKAHVPSIEQIAKNHSTAESNSRKVLDNLSQSQGLLKLTASSTIRDEDERNQWLCTHCKTFSTVHEAISFLRKQA